MDIETVVDARKERLDADAAWEILGQATTILTAKGRKIQTWHPQKDEKAAILADAIGRSGNLRAPTLRVGNDIFIGFNADLFDTHFASH